MDVPILYLSAYIINHKNEYYEYLNKVTAQQSWKEWILYMLKAIEETSLYTVNTIHAIDNLFLKTLDLVNKKLPHIHKEIIERIFEQPYISPKILLGRNIKSINTAKKYLTQLEETGIMVSKKIGKETVYLNIDLFNLLSET